MCLVILVMVLENFANIIDGLCSTFFSFVQFCLFILACSLFITFKRGILDYEEIIIIIIIIIGAVFTYIEVSGIYRLGCC